MFDVEIGELDVSPPDPRQQILLQCCSAAVLRGKKERGRVKQNKAKRSKVDHDHYTTACF